MVFRTSLVQARSAMPRAKQSPRALAARNVHAVLSGRSLDERIAGVKDADQALVSALTIGTIRYWYSLSEVIAHCLQKPLRQKDSIVLCLLAVGAFQLRHSRIPAHAAVHETVAASGAIGRPWAKGLINQVLRTLSQGPWPEPDSVAARFDHPDWLCSRLAAQYPDSAGDIMAASLTRAPMTLRVNARRGSRAQYMATLADAGIAARAGRVESAVHLHEPRAVAALPGFADGRVSVQDEGAQWAASVLDARAGERVLDACAAPGGKALHCLEQADVAMTALDISDARCALIDAEATRLGLRNDLRVITADATNLDWWDGNTFDKVLIDAPCSGTGTLRRHPDIKLLKDETDLGPYQVIQSKLARTLAQVVKPGGALIYCTCSVLDEENDEVILRLLDAQPEFRLVDVDAAIGAATRCGRQILPTVGGSDGFYYARLVRE